MKTIYLFIIVAIGLSITSCKHTDVKQKQLESIRILEKDLYSSQILDREKGLHMIDTYVNYSKQYPEDTISADFLFKASEIAMNLKLGSQAIFYYDKILSNYSDFYKAPECLFLKAFVYENQLNDLQNAKKYYNLFLVQYPKHALAKDAKASLKYLGKSPEELVKMFEQNNKQ